MKKAIKLFTGLSAIVLMLSFTNKSSFDFIGTYRVCKADPSQIKLTVNADHTFYYQDFSNPDKKIVANGSWILNGKKIILNANSSVNKFHNVWTFDSTGRVAKSHKGLTFYRLTKIDL